MNKKIEDTYAEAFEGIYCRVIVTADDEEILRKAAEDATATPSIVIGRTEGGIEKWLSENETPDGRKGVILQFWGGIDERKPLEESVKKFEIELSYRIRQDILVKPFTALFDASINPTGRLDMMERVGHCGDGYEWEEQRHGRRMIIVPIMVPDFKIERYIGYGLGVMGGNFWYMCRTKRAVLEAGRKALKAIENLTDNELNELAKLLTGEDIINLANGIDIIKVAKKLMKHPIMATKIALRLLS